MSTDVKFVLPLLSHFEHRSFRVTYFWPLCAKMTSSMKPEVHNVSQRRQRTTEKRHYVTRQENLVKIGNAVSEIRSRTDTQTHKLADTRHTDRLITIKICYQKIVK